MCECGEFNFVTTDCEMKKKIRKQTIKICFVECISSLSIQNQKNNKYIPSWIWKEAADQSKLMFG